MYNQLQQWDRQKVFPALWEYVKLAFQSLFVSDKIVTKHIDRYTVLGCKNVHSDANQNARLWGRAGGGSYKYHLVSTSFFPIVVLEHVCDLKDLYKPLHSCNTPCSWKLELTNWQIPTITIVSRMKGWEYGAPVIQINAKCWLQATGAHRQKSYRNKTNICLHQSLRDMEHNISLKRAKTRGPIWPQLNYLSLDQTKTSWTWVFLQLTAAERIWL